jgi:2-haloacid dehalogenase
MSMDPAARSPDIYVFDAYGTLFDVHSAVARHRDLIGPQAERLSELWRAKQLEYTWVRSLMGAHKDFWTLTREALDHASARIGGIEAPARDALLDAYRTLSAYPDVRPALERLKEQGARTAILSNGTADMLEAAVLAAGLQDVLDAVLSIEAVHIFKTDPRTYALMTRRFDCHPADISFQSSNRWDIAGAVQFGCVGVWINRSGLPDDYLDLPPARVLCDLSTL